MCSTCTPVHNQRDIPIRSAPDPTESETLRGEWKRDFSKRERRIKGDMRATVIKNDAFRLKERRPDDGRTQDELPPALSDYLRPNPRLRDRLQNDAHITDTRPHDLRAVEDSARLDQLDAWLEFVFNRRLVEPMAIEKVRNGEHYTAEYLKRAYMKGDRLALRDLKRAGFDVETVAPTDLLFDDKRDPVIHEVYTAVYRDLKYLAGDMRRKINRRAEEALSGTTTLTDFYEAIRDPLAGDGSNRLGQIVDVRVVETVNKATMRRFRETSGLDSLTLQVEGPSTNDEHGGSSGPSTGTDSSSSSSSSDEEDESEDVYAKWVTAGDDLVCEQCAQYGGEVWDIEAIAGQELDPPLHPNCRCRWRVISQAGV